MNPSSIKSTLIWPLDKASSVGPTPFTVKPEPSFSSYLVEVLKRLYGEVRAGGDEAFAVFLAEKLPELLGIAVKAVEGVDIDRVVVMDGGQGEGVSNALNQRVKGAYGTMEGLASVLGLDIQGVLQRAVGDGSEGAGPPRLEAGEDVEAE